MKISGFNSVKSGSGVKRRGGTSAVGSFADLLGASEAGDASAASATAPTAATSATSNLLSLQEVQDDSQGRARLTRQGFDMLDSLEQLRHALLTGSIPMHILRNLNNQLSAKKQYVTDPHLLSVIEDIELRASVELAKLETAVLNRQAGRDDLLEQDDI